MFRRNDVGYVLFPVAKTNDRVEHEKIYEAVHFIFSLAGRLLMINSELLWEKPIDIFQ